MGGYSAIAATGILLLALLPAIWIISTGMYKYYDIIKYIEVEVDSRGLIVREDISIIVDSVQWINNTSLNLSISNDGEIGYPYRYLNRFTIILEYTSINGYRNVYIPYLDPINGYRWEIIGVIDKYLNSSEVINPYRNINGSISGIWDPGEIIIIRISLDTSEPIQDNTIYRIIVSTENGESDEYRGVYP